MNKIRIELVQKHFCNMPDFDSLRSFLTDMGASNIRIVNKKSNRSNAYSFSIEPEKVRAIENIVGLYYMGAWDRTARQWFDPDVYRPVANL
jgi:hypothetical protein